MVKYREQVREDSIKQSLNTPLFRWLAWLDKNSSPELLEEAVKMDTAIKTADRRLEHVTQDDEDMWAYTRYLMGECDRTAELNFAREEGAKQGTQYVLDLLDQGLSTEEIKERLK